MWEKLRIISNWNAKNKKQGVNHESGAGDKIPKLISGDFSEPYINYYNSEDILEFVYNNNNLYLFVHNYLKDENKKIIEKFKEEEYLENGFSSFEIEPEEYQLEAFPFYFLKQTLDKYQTVNDKSLKVEEGTILLLQSSITTPESKRKLLIDIENNLKKDNELIINRINYESEKNTDSGELLKEITLLCFYLLEKQVKENKLIEDNITIETVPRKRIGLSIKTKPIPKDQSNPDN